MQVCHFGFALSFYCPFFVILLCFGKCKTNASKKTPNLRTAKHHRPKEIEKNADHWNLAPPILTVSSNHPESAIYIFFPICAHGFGDLSISFRYTFWETPRSFRSSCTSCTPALGQATVYNPCGSSNPRTQSRRGFKMRGSPGHAMPCLKHGEPGEPPGMELNTKTCYLCFGNHYRDIYRL